MYRHIQRIRELYASLRDDLSRDIFLAQMQLDMAPSLEHALKLDALCSNIRRDGAEQVGKALVAQLQELTRQNKKIVIHGTGATGQRVATFILGGGLDFYAFCSRSGWRYPNGLMGKPAYPTEWLFDCEEEVFVLVLGYNGEVLDILRRNGFPEDHIIPYTQRYDFIGGPAQYFEFPELFRRGTAFVEGGCFNADDTIRFARWCEGDYSRIFAFEPDERNYERCRLRLDEAAISNVELIPAAMAGKTGYGAFTQKESTGSFLTEGRGMEYDPALVRDVRVRAIDDVVGEHPVGMIKMDIEGGEFSALHGAERTIMRDRPLLAICTYHRVGDMAAIMDYCKQIVPGYTFYLRQYGAMTNETVMYASVKAD